MDPEIKELLEKNLALAEDNNRILRQLRFTNRLHIVWTVFYIAFILGSLLFAYSFLGPYFESARNTYESIVDTNTKVNGGLDSVKGFFGGSNE